MSKKREADCEDLQKKGLNWWHIRTILSRPVSLLSACVRVVVGPWAVVVLLCCGRGRQEQRRGNCTAESLLLLNLRIKKRSIIICRRVVACLAQQRRRHCSFILRTKEQKYRRGRRHRLTLLGNNRGFEPWEPDAPF